MACLFRVGPGFVKAIPGYRISGKIGVASKRCTTVPIAPPRCWKKYELPLFTLFRPLCPAFSFAYKLPVVLLNVNKTKAMVFHMPQKRIQLPLIKIAGEDIAFVDNFNFLGIIINKHLNWTSHVDMLSAKLSKTIGILNTLKHVLPIKTYLFQMLITNLQKGVYGSSPHQHITLPVETLLTKYTRIVLLDFVYT